VILSLIGRAVGDMHLRENFCWVFDLGLHLGGGPKRVIW
jgi:hypothetical protein